MFLKFAISLNQGEKKRRFHAGMKNVQTWRQAVGLCCRPPPPLTSKLNVYVCLSETVVFRLSTSASSGEGGIDTLGKSTSVSLDHSINQLIVSINHIYRPFRFACQSYVNVFRLWTHKNENCDWDTWSSYYLVTTNHYNAVSPYSDPHQKKKTCLTRYLYFFSNCMQTRAVCFPMTLTVRRLW